MCYLNLYIEELPPHRATQVVAARKRPYANGLVQVLGPVEALGSLEEGDS